VGIPVSVQTAGAWTNDPASFAYQWYSCSTPVTCTAISGATDSTYTPTAAQTGDTLQLAVTASSANGSGQSTTPQTTPVS
jgi:hypothetical protein